MKTTDSRMGRSGWLKIVALVLLSLVAIPLLLRKQKGEVLSSHEEAVAMESAGSSSKGVKVGEGMRGVSADGGEALEASKPTKVRDRSVPSGLGESVAQQESSGSNNFSEERGQQRAGVRSNNRRQRVSGGDGSFVEEGGEISRGSGAVASGMGVLSAEGGHGGVGNHATGDAAAASPAAAGPSAVSATPPASKPVITRPPEMPISHLIDDEVAAAVAPQVPADTMEAIRQTFEQEAGVNELAQDDPAYAERWAEAEPAAAERIRAMYGWDAFAAFQRKVVMEKLAAQNTANSQ
ncbi:hypothetical protein [Luteolibacter soli]|uniref:Uncharacterized protein n=1 Tax=Luteolibacter soli TaxID=3135280 RepID=A0ABU9AYL7_9BACT